MTSGKIRLLYVATIQQESQEIEVRRLSILRERLAAGIARFLERLGTGGSGVMFVIRREYHVSRLTPFGPVRCCSDILFFSVLISDCLDIL